MFWAETMRDSRISIEAFQDLKRLSHLLLVLGEGAPFEEVVRLVEKGLLRLEVLAVSCHRTTTGPGARTFPASVGKTKVAALPYVSGGSYWLHKDAWQKADEIIALREAIEQVAEVPDEMMSA
jgi:hypothetical protein